MTNHVMILFARKSTFFLIFIKIDGDELEINILFNIYAYTDTVSIVNKYLNKQQQV